ncbi:MAG: hypothetical protein V3S06_05610 [candidate division Zixibacteria bacterium]
MVLRIPEIPGYSRRPFIASTIGAVAFLFFLACSNNRSDKQVNDLYFDVVDSLLASEIELGSSGWRVRPPRNLTALPESLMADFRKILSSSLKDSTRITLLGILMSEETRASLMISRIAGLNLQSDTAGFMENYRDALRSEDETKSIESGDFRHGKVYVKNFLVSDSTNVQFRLICFKPSDDAIELIYTTPRAVYSDFVKSIESSIGSLH